MNENYSITFIDSVRNREVSYDKPTRIDILESGIIKIRCSDGFCTFIKNEEWNRIEIEKWK